MFEPRRSGINERKTMKTLRASLATAALVCVWPALAATVTLQVSHPGPYELGSKVWLVGRLDGAGQHMAMYVNGVKGGNVQLGKINDQNGEYRAPEAMPPGGQVTISASTGGMNPVSGSIVLKLAPALPSISGITPAKVQCGVPFTLTVSGQRYVAGSTVWVGQQALATAFGSASKLTANGVSSAGGNSLAIRVVNPDGSSSGIDYRVKVGACSAPPTNPPPTNPPPTNPPPTNPPPTNPPPTNPPPVDPLPAIPSAPVDAAQLKAVRFLEQASFGATPAEIAQVRSSGPEAWIAQQLAMPASPIVAASDLNGLRRNWYLNMANGKDQLRQRMVFALSQIFVISTDKNPYAGEIEPWLVTLSQHAFGNFGILLREMTLNPAMGKYLDLGNSVLPSPNENYAREVVQLFTVGPVLLNQDGSVQRDSHGEPIPAYDQAVIAGLSRALSGWTYSGPNKTGTNWENFSGPLQPRDAYHDKGVKLLLNGITLPAGQSTQQDFDAVMDNLFNHPNVAPFIATRLIRHFVKSNPSPAYIERVAQAFDGQAGRQRGDLAATLSAVLLDPEGRDDAADASSGHLRDPMLHTLGLLRALNAKVVNPTNMLWDYYLQGQQIATAPSVFNFYSPMTRLPGAPELYGPEFQLYAPSLAVGRANMIYNILSGEYDGMVKVDISAYTNAANNPAALINLVDANLLAGRMSPGVRATLATALPKISNRKQRAITALYLTAASADFAISK
jgi:uncharacterized protein (DUF1800 family)